MNTKTTPLVAVLVLCLVGNAYALTVSVDPGPVGSMITNYSTGQIALPGPNSESVAVFFDDMKHLKFDTGGRLVLNLNSFGGPAGGGNFVSDITWGLADMDGNAIFSDTEFNATIATAGGGYAQFDIPDGLIAHAFFVEFDPDFGPIGSNANIAFSYDQNGKVTVGEWVIPEPTTIALAGLGLVGVACSRRRRN